MEPYLYKIVSKQHWEESKSLKYIILSDNDQEFIHLSTEDQLNKIIQKYWAGVEEYVIIKLDPSKLRGDLVFETNPGGTNKYYHLYNGSIPLDAVVEIK